MVYCETTSLKQDDGCYVEFGRALCRLLSPFRRDGKQTWQVERYHVPDCEYLGIFSNLDREAIVAYLLGMASISFGYGGANYTVRFIPKGTARVPVPVPQPPKQVTEKAKLPKVNSKKAESPPKLDSDSKKAKQPKADVKEVKESKPDSEIAEQLAPDCRKIELPSKADSKRAEVPTVDSKKVESPRKGDSKKAGSPRKADTKKAEPPQVDSKVKPSPKVDSRKAKQPKAELKKDEPPKVNLPKAEPPKVDSSKSEQEKADTKEATTGRNAPASEHKCGNCGELGHAKVQCKRCAACNRRFGSFQKRAAHQKEAKCEPANANAGTAAKTVEGSLDSNSFGETSALSSPPRIPPSTLPSPSVQIPTSPSATARSNALSEKQCSNCHEKGHSKPQCRL